MKQLVTLKLLSTSLVCLFFATDAYAIKKCKDAEGKWHYGDNAEEVCSKSKVTTLTDRGFVKGTLDAPKSEEELRVAEEIQRREEEEQARIKREQEEKDRILSIYERPEDIDRQRDNKLASVDGNIRVHEAYLKQMDKKIKRLEDKSATARGQYKEDIEKELAASKVRVEEFSNELIRLQEQRKGIVEQFAKEKEEYLKLTSES